MTQENQDHATKQAARPEQSSSTSRVEECEFEKLLQRAMLILKRGAAIPGSKA